MLFWNAPDISQTGAAAARGAWGLSGLGAGAACTAGAWSGLGAGLHLSMYMPSRTPSETRSSGTTTKRVKALRGLRGDLRVWGAGAWSPRE